MRSARPLLESTAASQLREAVNRDFGSSAVAEVGLAGEAALSRGDLPDADLAADVRTGVLDAEHVLGIGAAVTTLAQSTMRRPVQTALDVGTGCGIQALHLSRHSEQITATDLSLRALRLAATTAALNELSWDLRQGSFAGPGHR